LNRVPTRTFIQGVVGNRGGSGTKIPSGVGRVNVWGRVTSRRNRVRQGWGGTGATGGYCFRGILPQTADGGGQIASSSILPVSGCTLVVFSNVGEEEAGWDRTTAGVGAGARGGRGTTVIGRGFPSNILSVNVHISSSVVRVKIRRAKLESSAGNTSGGCCGWCYGISGGYPSDLIYDRPYSHSHGMFIRIDHP
jgi:hypothetical protein